MFIQWPEGETVRDVVKDSELIDPTDKLAELLKKSPVCQGRQGVLIVEDNEFNGLIIRRMLEKEGFTCECVATAKDALDYLSRVVPVMVLMDIELPDADGLALTRHIREGQQFRQVPIIAVTAHVNNDTMRRAMEVGCDDFIGKPFTREYFVNIVHKHVL